jgi:hypothetical protein
MAYDAAMLRTHRGRASVLAVYALGLAASSAACSGESSPASTCRGASCSPPPGCDEGTCATGGGGAGSSGGAGPGRGGGGGSGGDEPQWTYGTDCPTASPSSLPASSPRILILGEFDVAPATIAAHLRGMLSNDPAFTAPDVVGQTIEAFPDDGFGGASLMNFFYQPDGRAERLAALSEPWSHVVLIEQRMHSIRYPEFYFEGVRTLGCSARAAGAKPIVLMTWSTAPDADLRGEVTYRVANGTNSIVSPAGYAWASAFASLPITWQRDDIFVAAASLYSTLTGKDGRDTGYQPAEIPSMLAGQLSGLAHATVVSEAENVHYLEPYRGRVEVRAGQPGGDLWFMAAGTSSEHIWSELAKEILPKAGLTPHATEIGASNPQKTFDAASLESALPHFEAQQYGILFARSYALDAAEIAAAGAQSDLQVQIWDRYADADPSDGLAAVGMMEFMSVRAYDSASSLGLTLVPFHLMFSKLKTMRPSVQLLSDGVHATYPVAYGLASMSAVSRTGLHVPTDGLAPDAELAARLADETIRQLSSLSVTGSFVPDDPATRPTAR